MDYIEYQPMWRKYYDFYTELGFPRKITSAEEEYAKELCCSPQDGLSRALSLPRFVYRAQKDKQFSQKWIQ